MIKGYKSLKVLKKFKKKEEECSLIMIVFLKLNIFFFCKL